MPMRSSPTGSWTPPRQGSLDGISCRDVVGRRGSRRFVRPSATAVLIVALLAGCSGSPPGGPGADGTTGSPTASATSDASTIDALLPAAQMPAWNEATEWEEAPDAQEDVLVLCRLPDLSMPIDRAERRYTSDTLRGVNTVSVFADANSAAEAASALDVGASNCIPPDISSPRPRSSHLSTLPTGSTWIVSAPADGDDTRFEFIGIGRAGRVVTLVGFTLTAQDANFEQDPLAPSVEASLARIHQTLPNAAGASPSASATTEPRASDVYYLTGWGTDELLAREVHQVAASALPDDAAAAVITEMLTAPAEDPDYTSGWNPATRVLSVRRDAGVITVDLSGEARLAQLTGQAAEATAQQLVYTVTAAYGRDDPVQLLVEGEPAGLLWDAVDWASPIARAPELETRLLVQIDSPRHGGVVDRRFRVTGEAASFEALLWWSLQSPPGTEVMSGTAMAAAGDRLAPFDFAVSLPADRPAGEYLLVLEQDDPSGGAAEPGPMRDDKTINIG